MMQIVLFTNEQSMVKIHNCFIYKRTEHGEDCFIYKRAEHGEYCFIYKRTEHGEDS